MTTTAIAAVAPRTPVVIRGQVLTVRAHLRPWVRLHVELSDGTGTIILRFMGRTELPGVRPGCQLRVEGTPSVDGPALVILNPAYECVARGQTEPSG